MEALNFTAQREAKAFWQEQVLDISAEIKEYFDENGYDFMSEDADEEDDEDEWDDEDW